MRRLGAVVLLAGLAACSDGGDRRQVEAPAPPSSTSPSPAAPAAAVSPLGGGSALSGEVGGLTGDITGFAFRQTTTQTIVELAADVLFAFGSAELTPQAEAALGRTAELIRQGGAGTVQVIGHTDAIGDDASNLSLSRRRAEAVVGWLQNRGGVASDRLRPEGRGEAEPVAPNLDADRQDDPAGRAKNRRVVVLIPRAA